MRTRSLIPWAALGGACWLALGVLPIGGKPSPDDSGELFLPLRQQGDYVIRLEHERLDPKWEIRIVIKDREVAARVEWTGPHQLDVKVAVAALNEHARDTERVRLEMKIVGYSEGKAVFLPAPVTLLLPSRFPIEYRFTEHYQTAEVRSETGPVVHVAAARPDYGSLKDEAPGWYSRQTNRYYHPGSFHRRLGPSDMLPVTGTAQVTIPPGCTMFRDTVRVQLTGLPEWVQHRAPQFSADGHTATVAFWNYSFDQQTASVTVQYQLPGGTLTQQDREVPAPSGTPKKRLPMGSFVVPLSASYQAFTLHLKFEDGREATITPDRPTAAGVQAAVEAAAHGKQLRLTIDWPGAGVPPKGAVETVQLAPKSLHLRMPDR